MVWVIDWKYWLGLSSLLLLIAILAIFSLFSDKIEPATSNDHAEIMQMKQWKRQLSKSVDQIYQNRYQESRCFISKPFWLLLRQHGIWENPLWLEWNAWYPTKTIREIKAVYGRPRPFVVDPTIGRSAKWSDRRLLAHSGAYPSGHSACSKYLAKTLGRKYPQIKRELNRLADQIGWSRVWAGLHYPSDHLGGQEIGKRLAV